MKCKLPSCEELTKRPESSYCSLSCSNKGRPRRIKTIVKTCINCNSDFLVTGRDKRKKFCSRSCSAKFNNIKKLVLCIRCNKPCGTGKKYCSVFCRDNHKTDEWLAGKLNANGKYQISKWARRYVFEQAGYRCEGFNTKTQTRCEEDRLKPSGNTVLTIDHIDGNWQNSWRENLRALCPTCHALTETYGAANMGKGRTWKREYNQYQPKVDNILEDMVE